MEDVLETYKKPCDKRFPVLCMDEQPVQLLKETRISISPRCRDGSVEFPKFRHSIPKSAKVRVDPE